jgi:hypothetical protein
MAHLPAPSHPRLTPHAVRAVALTITARSVASQPCPVHTHVRRAADGVHHIRLVADLVRPWILRPGASASNNHAKPTSLRTATKRASPRIRRLTYMSILEAAWLQIEDESTIKEEIAVNVSSAAHLSREQRLREGQCNHYSLTYAQIASEPSTTSMDNHAMTQSRSLRTWERR